MADETRPQLPSRCHHLAGGEPLDRRVVVRRAGPLTTPVDRELVILDMRQDHYLGLDLIGRGSRSCSSPSVRRCLFAALEGHFAVSAEICRADVLAFLEQLVDADRVEMSLELRLVPLARTVRLLGRLRTGHAGDVPTNPARLQEAQWVGRIVARIAHRLPRHPTCLRQGLAVQRMLRRRGMPSELHLGLAAKRRTRG
jgi:hypothetical protein